MTPRMCRFTRVLPSKMSIEINLSRHWTGSAELFWKEYEREYLDHVDCWTHSLHFRQGTVKHFRNSIEYHHTFRMRLHLHERPTRDSTTTKNICPATGKMNTRLAFIQCFRVKRDYRSLDLHISTNKANNTNNKHNTTHTTHTTWHNATNNTTHTHTQHDIYHNKT